MICNSGSKYGRGIGTNFVYTFRSPEFSQGKLNKVVYAETKTGIKIQI
jgi:hypothetical protein